MSWLQLFAVFSGLVGFVVLGLVSWGTRPLAVWMNWLIAAGFGAQVVLLSSFHPAIEETNQASSQIDLNCDHEQLARLRDVKFVRTEPRRNGFGVKRNFEVIDDEKIVRRLTDVSELVLCLDSKLSKLGASPASTSSEAEPESVEQPPAH